MAWGGVQETVTNSEIDNKHFYVSNDETDEEVDIMVIGNSITYHRITDYWFGEWGMAATTEDNDYVHVLANMLSSESSVDFTCVNFVSWETMWYDRAETLPLLTSFLDNSYDIIIIQLGENIDNYDTLETDFEELITYLRSYSTKAKIMLVGNFWENYDVENIKCRVSEDCGTIYVSLEDMWDVSYYQLGEGREVYGNDGEWHLSEHSGVNVHPGDLGMQEIALRIYEAYNSQ